MKRIGKQVYIMLDAVNIATCPNCAMGGATLKESILLLCSLSSIEIFLKMRHEYEKVTVWWSFSTVLNKHNLIVKILGIILFFAEIHTPTSSHAIFVTILFEGNIMFSYLRATSSHAIFIMILFEPDFHVLMELLLFGQSLLWFRLKGNIIFSPFEKSFFSCNIWNDFISREISCSHWSLLLMQSLLL